MLTIYKAFIVVIVFTTLVFVLTRPLFCKFMSVPDFAVRRNVWLGLTIAAFLIPNYWAFALVSVGLIAYGARRDSNPAALYVFLLLAIPPLGKDLPTFGIVNQIFELNHFRVLSLVLLLPVALRHLGSVNGSGDQLGWAPRSRRSPADVLILLYCALQIALSVPYDSITATLRRAVLLSVDMLLPYFVLSRGCRSRDEIKDVMAAFALGAFIMAPLAAFESLRGWLMYAGLEEHWGTEPFLTYLTRDDSLRAQVTSGHSIVLGYSMAMAFGFWLYLQTRLLSAAWRWLGFGLILTGLAFTYARGPWLGAVALWLIFLTQGPNATSRALKAFGLMTVVGSIVFVSPWGGKLVDSLPFIGSADQGTITYREQLAKMSWTLIQQNPVFGSRGFSVYLESLRQGEGIIDMVNAYASIALGSGLAGLSLFLGFFGVIAVTCFGAVRKSASADPDLSLMGSSLFACLCASLLIIFTVNLYLSVGYVVWAIAGLTLAYGRLARNQEAVWLGAPKVPGAALQG